MSQSKKQVRQSITLPFETARYVRRIAASRRLSANRAIVELVEEGIKAQERKRERLFELTQQLRAATDSKDVESLGNELGRMVFGG
jgi:hypothetical protein